MDNEIKDLTKLSPEEEMTNADHQKILEDEKKADEFNEFLTFTRERFDKHFDKLGYFCIVFDKSNPKNAFVAAISNVTTGFYMEKLIPFISKHKRSLRELKKNLGNKLKRVQ